SDLAALGGAMTGSPALRAAVAGTDGAPPLGRVAALAIARRVPRVENEDPEWIALARKVTVRELKNRIRENRNGDGPRCEPEDTEESDAVALDVRLEVPRNVAAAFEDTLDLHRAINGYSASRESFLEALGAEAAAGPRPPDASCEPARRGQPRIAIEESFDQRR